MVSFVVDFPVYAKGLTTAFDYERVEKLFWWVIERSWVMFFRDVLGHRPPWTKDPILQRYRFCMPFRELDCGTRLLLHHMRNFSGNQPPEVTPELLLWVSMYRYSNGRRFFSVMPQPPRSIEEFVRMVDIYARQFERTPGVKRPFAYAVPYTKHIFRNRWEQLEKKYRRVLQENFTNRSVWVVVFLEAIEEGKFSSEAVRAALESPQKLFEHLVSIQGVGGFLAYEIVTDISYILDSKEWSPLRLVNLGPGAVPAIHILSKGVEDSFENYRVGAKEVLQKEEYEHLFKHLLSLQSVHLDCRKFQAVLESLVEKLWPPYAPKPDFLYPLSPRNLEHSLCEFRKWFVWSNFPERRGAPFSSAQSKPCIPKSL